MKLQSVEEFFYKRETVEKYNDDKIIKLNWECPDVLFSFRGVYAIGVFIYYRQLFVDNVKTDIMVKDEKGATRQRLYSDPSGARFPRRTAILPSVPIALSYGRIISSFVTFT